ncbi:MAG: hypothetical protein JKY18_00685 [Flavobacteriales bacterium]|nr:hypothetical protein [Flavobacteriales bacterium]
MKIFELNDGSMICEKQLKWIWSALLLIIMLTVPMGQAHACDGNTGSFTGIVDNGDGTFTISMEICLALDVNWGGTDDFNLTPSGGTYGSIASVQTTSFTTSYLYCAAGCATCFMCSGCADGAAPITGGGTASVTSGMGGITVAASGGNAIAPDDLSTFCINQPVEVCGTITFTTNGILLKLFLKGQKMIFVVLQTIPQIASSKMGGVRLR